MIDKLKEMEKPQLIVIGLVVTALITIVIYLFKPDEVENNEQLNALELPEDRDKTDNFNSKLDAYNVNEPTGNNLDLDFDKGLFGETKDTASMYAEEEDPKVQELQRQIELMEEKNSQTRSNPQPSSYQPPPNNYQPAPSQKETESEYRERLIRAREQRMKLSQDYSANRPEEIQTNPVDPFVEFRVAIYRDQFILPGDRVTLILTQPMQYKGNLFPRNTFVYATANIQQSRVLLNITNINSVPVNLVAKDIQDGNIGLYNQRAGELWREYQAQSQTETVDNVSDDVSRQVNIPLAGSAIRAFSNFFRKKKYTNNQKILLLDNHELLLINKQ